MLCTHDTRGNIHNTRSILHSQQVRVFAEPEKCADRNRGRERKPRGRIQRVLVGRDGHVAAGKKIDGTATLQRRVRGLCGHRKTQQKKKS